MLLLPCYSFLRLQVATKRKENLIKMYSTPIQVRNKPSENGYYKLNVSAPKKQSGHENRDRALSQGFIANFFVKGVHTNWRMR